jgi:hypothetical protein
MMFLLNYVFTKAQRDKEYSTHSVAYSPRNIPGHYLSRQKDAVAGLDILSGG